MQKLKLKYPIKDGGEEIQEISVRRPKVRDQLAASKTGKNDVEHEIALFASLCDLTPDLIGELDFADYQEVQSIYTGFLS